MSMEVERDLTMDHPDEVKVNCLLCELPVSTTSSMLWIQCLDSDTPNILRTGYHCHTECIRKFPPRITTVKSIDLGLLSTNNSTGNTSLSVSPHSSNHTAVTSPNIIISAPECYPVQHHTDPSYRPIFIVYEQ